MNLVPLGFLDVSAFAATYVQKYRSREHPLVLRTVDGNTDLYTEWKSARALLTRIKNAAAPFTDGEPPELGNVTIETLAPGDYQPWHADESDYRREFHELRVCIIPSPGGWTYCAGEAMVLPWGQVVAVNRAAASCEVNFGPTSRTHLIVDIRRVDKS
jgi:hypothetical protein